MYKINRPATLIILSLCCIIIACFFRIGFIDRNKINSLEEQIEILNQENITLDRENMDLTIENINRYNFTK